VSVDYIGEAFPGGILGRGSSKGQFLVVAGVIGLLGILVLQMALSIRQESITWDEDDHLYAGYMSWKTGDFGLNPEHPPMVKMLAALPILGMDLKAPELQRRNFKHEAFLGGKDSLFKNDANTMLFRARMMASLLTLLLAVLVFLAAQVLWGFYGFRYAARPAGFDLNPTSAEYLQQLSRPGEAKLLTTIAHYHLLPESYIYGLADVRMMADFYSSYLLGTTYPHGVWFYFPLVIVIKSTLPFLILLAITAWAIATGRLRCWREILFLTVPPVLYLVVAMSSRMNIGMRHILPMYPFLTVLIAGAAWTLIQRNRRWMYAISVLVVFQIVTSLHAYPVYIPYANELWGGPSQTYKLLSDSNSDWGEQLKATKKYLDQRGVKDCWFIYFAEGVAD
jgi:hypothetical protein